MAQKTLKAELIDERLDVTVHELCRACSASTDWVIELVEEGVLEPAGSDPQEWLFAGRSLMRAHAAMRLQQDLRLNIAGVALVLDLIEELGAARERLRRLEARDEA
jgi:chaperone modulatory protein CbpM